MSCGNFFVLNDMYKTGPIPFQDTNRRLKQGLQSQLLSNNCAKCDIVNQKSGCISCDIGLYPAQQVHWNYGIPEIPRNCPCLVYLQPI